MHGRRARRPDRRAAPRRDRRRRSALTTSGRAPSYPSSGRRGHRAGVRWSVGDRLILGFDDGRLPTLDGRPRSVWPAWTSPSNQSLGTRRSPDRSGCSRLTTASPSRPRRRTGSRWSIVERRLDVVGSLDLPGIEDLAGGGAGPALVATLAEVDEPAAVATRLAELLGGSAEEYETKLTRPAGGPTVVLGSPGSDDTRTAVTAAIADGSLPGLAIEEVPRIAVATADGITFVDTVRGAVVRPRSTCPAAPTDWRLSPALTTRSCTPRPARRPSRPYAVVAIAGDSAKDGPADRGSHPLPGPGTRVVYDASSQQVHILGTGPRVGRDPPRIPGPCTSSSRTGTPSTRMRACPMRSCRSPGRPTSNRSTRPTIRSACSCSSGDGVAAEVDLGSHAFAWRLPGVLAGALTAGLLFLLARILFRAPERGRPRRRRSPSSRGCSSSRHGSA